MKYRTDKLHYYILFFHSNLQGEKNWSSITVSCIPYGKQLCYVIFYKHLIFQFTSGLQLLSSWQTNHNHFREANYFKYVQKVTQILSLTYASWLHREIRTETEAAVTPAGGENSQTY